MTARDGEIGARPTGNSVDKCSETMFTSDMTPTTNLNTDREVAMSKFQCSPALADKLGIRHDWTVGKSAARVASAAGMPGFGEAFSRKALALVESGQRSLHGAFLGRHQ